MTERKKDLRDPWLNQTCGYGLPEIPDQEVVGAIESVPEHYSANLHVDVGNTAMFVNSISTGAPANSGAVFGLSGATVGQWVDLINTGTFTNVWVTAGGGVSGVLSIQVQTNDVLSGNVFSGGAPVSGSFTDPTSGLAQFPTWFASGGILYVNSGLYTTPGTGGTSGPSTQVAGATIYTLPFGTNPIQQGQGGNAFIGSGSAPEFASGGIAFAGFQRPGRYARLIWLSGSTQVNFLTAGFLGQLATTGSGGGFSQSPQTSGAVVV